MPNECKWLLVLSWITITNTTFPNFYIFKCKCFKHCFIAKCEFGVTMAMWPKTWMTSILFNKWIHISLFLFKLLEVIYGQLIITYSFCKVTICMLFQMLSTKQWVCNWILSPCHHTRAMHYNYLMFFVLNLSKSLQNLKEMSRH